MKTKFHGSPGLPGRQRGAVLIVGLVMLTVMTMLVVSMMKTSIIDLKIGGVGQDALVNFNNAEIGLHSYFANNSGNLSHNCLTLAPPTCANYTLPAIIAAPVVVITATQVTCGDPHKYGEMVGSGFPVVVFDAVATATSGLGNTLRIHMGISQELPTGSC
jgi:Tfp pilus assembly protein PilX